MTNDIPSHAIVINSPPPMDGMIGVGNLKNMISAIRAGTSYRNAMATYDAKINSGFQNALIVGPQGTGKTTFAKILAFEYRTAGIISPSAQVHFINAMDLVGRYTGLSEEKTRELLSSITDGVLIVDEIDSLLDARDYGTAIFNTLNVHMGNSVNKPVIIATCYSSRKEELFKVNIGLEGRFRHLMHMPHYETEDLTAMFSHKVLSSGLVLGPGVQSYISGLLTRVKTAKGSSFANAREVQNIFDATLDAHAARLQRQGINISQIDARK